MNIEITLLATNEYQAQAFEKSFDGLPNAKVFRGQFESLGSIDCLVSPANSFGLMDGGMDAAITNYFGTQLQERVRAHIIEEFYGEQPVGTSFVIETNDRRIPYLAHTPTMRVPAVIAGTENAYRAMKATLLAVLQSNANIRTAAIPAFGAGAGGMHGYKVAEQMALAYQHVLNPPSTIDWNYARLRDYEINGRI